jgi:hypothetical protein
VPAAAPTAQTPTSGTSQYLHEDWTGSQTDFARINQSLEFEIGIGNGRWGYGYAGIEIAGVRTVKVLLSGIPDQYASYDGNSFAGFVIDYRSNEGYVSRVRLGFGTVNAQRNDNAPIGWGTRKKGDRFETLDKQSTYTIDLARYAPPKWNGTVCFVIGLQNAGENKSLKGKIEFGGTASSASTPATVPAATPTPVPSGSSGR